MRALKPVNGAIPRAYPDSRRKVARRYREYCIVIQKAWGPLPPEALPTLREYGRAAIELEAMGLELEAAKARRRKRDTSRIRRSQFALREQLGRLEGRLRAFASSNGNGHDPLAAVRAAVEKANQRP